MKKPLWDFAAFLAAINGRPLGIKPETIIQRLADIIPRDPNEEALARGKAVVSA